MQNHKQMKNVKQMKSCAWVANSAENLLFTNVLSMFTVKYERLLPKISHNTSNPKLNDAEKLRFNC